MLNEELAAECAQLLGWPTSVTGLVVFGGIEFWASYEVEDGEVARRMSAGLGAVTDRLTLEKELLLPHGQRGLAPPLRVAGALVARRDPRGSIQQASLLAGYCQRAVVVDREVAHSRMAAAVLDQGVVVKSGPKLSLACIGGPRTGHGPLTAREWELRESVYASITDRPIRRKAS